MRSPQRLVIAKKLDPTSFAAAVITLRERLGKTQAQTAKLLDVSPRTLWQMENAERKTPYCTQIGVLDILADALNKR